jgi:hypothetical protein
MKNLIVTTILIFFQAVACYSQISKQIFSSPKLPSLIAKAKTVAILPLNVSISYKRLPKNMTVESIKEDEKKESIQMQQGMFTFLLRKSKDYTVSFQDVDQTNILLKKAGLFENIDETSPDILCRALNVDAVIKGSWSYAKTGSEAGAIATAVLLGMPKSTGSGQLVMQIYDAINGELMWRMAKEMNEGTFSSANELMERMMRKVGRNFPFEN